MELSAPHTEAALRILAFIFAAILVTGILFTIAGKIVEALASMGYTIPISVEGARRLVDTGLMMLGVGSAAAIVFLAYDLITREEA